MENRKIDSVVNNKMAKPETAPLPDYYWRDYFGTIPIDAVMGGCDVAGNPTYIGQALFVYYGILPGGIVKECNINLTAATYFTSVAGTTITSNGSKTVCTTNNYVKILCCNFPARLKWVKTCAEDIPKLTGRHLVAGGITVDNYIIYIGRVFYDRCTVVGPVLISDAYVKGVYVPDEHKKSKALTSFDVLIYEN